MPAQYEAMRDRLVSEGMSYDKAQEHAARMYNAKHPKAPMSGHHEGKGDAKRLAMKLVKRK